MPNWCEDYLTIITERKNKERVDDIFRSIYNLEEVFEGTKDISDVLKLQKFKLLNKKRLRSIRSSILNERVVIDKNILTEDKWIRINYDNIRDEIFSFVGSIRSKEYKNYLNVNATESNVKEVYEVKGVSYIGMKITIAVDRKLENFYKEIDDPISATVTFQSAWSAPTSFFSHICDIFKRHKKNAHIILRTFEPGMGFSERLDVRLSTNMSVIYVSTLLEATECPSCHEMFSKLTTMVTGYLEVLDRCPRCGCPLDNFSFDYNDTVLSKLLNRIDNYISMKYEIKRGGK